MKICISTWGDPSQWKYARYCLDNEKCCGGFSTLNLLLDRDGSGCDRIYIYTLDTLAKTLHKSYSDIVDDVKNYVEQYLCVDRSTDIDIHVVPGRMRKKISSRDDEVVVVEFRGDLENLRVLIMYSLYMKTLELLSKSNSKKVDIVVDTTHGINYLPTITVKAASEATAMLSTATLFRTDLYIYNADPYPQDIPQQYPERLKRSSNNVCKVEIDVEDKAPKLMYNKLSKEIVTPWHLTQFLHYTRDFRLIETPSLEGDSCRIDDQDTRDLVAFAKKIVASFRVGTIPQLLAYVKEEPDADVRIKEVLDKTLDCWNKWVSIDKRYEICVVEYRKIGHGFRLLLHAHAIIKGIKKFLDPDARDYIKLSEVERASGELFKNFIILSTLIKREIEELKNLNESGRIAENWTTYRDVRQQPTLQQPDVCRECREKFSGRKEMEKRILIAHAGFHSDLIEVKRIEKDVAIRIREECKDKVEFLVDSIAEDLVQH